ncbi:MAG: cell division protein ZapD [Gammaproteobacteria bacterium]|nr:cell division protein ZapD [Gammaproteobacteria bacterium]
MSEQLIFEQPLNERIRMFLRLEHLFSQYNQHLKHDSEWDTHSAIKAILDILSMVGRGDIKRETIKELERQNSNLQAFIEIPDINHGRLSVLIDEQNNCLQGLHAISGNIGQPLQQNELLNAIRQRLTVPGGLCDFDLPVYSHWLRQSFENRQAILKEWFKPFQTLELAINLILKVIRESTDSIDEVAESGFYQKTLESNQSCLLIRVMLPVNSNIFPEISAGKHRFSIRFLKTQNPAHRSEQEKQDVPFQLACCVL